MFSVITPAYNAEKYITQAMESVLAQGFEEWEMIVVDDGSTDRTCEIVSGYSAKDARVRLVQNQHGGVSHARNTGVRLAQFDWIALLDADDVFCKNKMRRQLDAAAADPEVVLWGTFAYNIGEEGKVFDVSEGGPLSREDYRELQRNAEVVMIKNSSAIFRKSLFEKLGGFDSQYDSSEDTELWNRMAEFGPVVVIPEPLIMYRFHSQSLSFRMIKFQYECLQFIRARKRARMIHSKDLTLEQFMTQYKKRSFFKKLLDWSIMHSNASWRYAGIQFTNGGKREGFGWLIRAFLLNPPMISWRIARKIGGRMKYLKSEVS